MLKALKNKPLALLIALALLVTALAGTVWTAGHYVAAGWRLYPRGQQLLDIREQNITKEVYSSLKDQLPETEILWAVPFQSERIPSDTTVVSVESLSEEDIVRLDFLTELTEVDARGCSDYEELRILRSRRPEVAVNYTVTLSGTAYDQDARTVRVPGLDREEAVLLAYLPELTVVDADGCRDYGLLRELASGHPEWDVRYRVEIGGEQYDHDAQQLTVTQPRYEDLADALGGFTRLEHLELDSPIATGAQLAELQQSYPDTDMLWYVDVLGRRVGSDTTELDLSGMSVDSVEQVEAAVEPLVNLQKLIMSECGIDNETMAAFRERKRDSYKVVWTVHFSDKLWARTDDTWFMPIDKGEYYFRDIHNVMNLKYCEDMVCIDVGHATITNADWLAYMPHLKYLILAHTCVSDISAISNCKELIYLELDWSSVRDYSPLQGCTALQDLNLNRTWGDPAPLTKLTWLKNLWWEHSTRKARELLTESLTKTHLEFLSKSSATGEGWRNLPNYYGQRDYLGKDYMR